jgi:transposase InsO family protein
MMPTTCGASVSERSAGGCARRSPSQTARAVLTTQAPAASAAAPESIVVDHGKVYVSEHLTSVCRRMGISIQPARLRTGRDKGPVERFLRTLREDLLQALPGYKGPDPC